MLVVLGGGGDVVICVSDSLMRSRLGDFGESCVCRKLVFVGGFTDVDIYRDIEVYLDIDIDMTYIDIDMTYIDIDIDI